MLVHHKPKVLEYIYNIKSLVHHISSLRSSTSPRVFPRCPEAGSAGDPGPDVRRSRRRRRSWGRLSCAGAEGIGSCHGAAEIDARGGAGQVNSLAK